MINHLLKIHNISFLLHLILMCISLLIIVKVMYIVFVSLTYIKWSLYSCYFIFANNKDSYLFLWSIISLTNIWSFFFITLGYNVTVMDHHHYVMYISFLSLTFCFKFNDQCILVISFSYTVQTLSHISTFVTKPYEFIERNQIKESILNGFVLLLYKLKFCLI